MNKLFRFDLSTVWLPYYGNVFDCRLIMSQVSRDSHAVWTEREKMYLDPGHQLLSLQTITIRASQIGTINPLYYYVHLFVDDPSINLPLIIETNPHL